MKHSQMVGPLSHNRAEESQTAFTRATFEFVEDFGQRMCCRLFDQHQFIIFVANHRHDSAVGSGHLAKKKKAIVQKLSAIESLAGTCGEVEEQGIDLNVHSLFQPALRNYLVVLALQPISKFWLILLLGSPSRTDCDAYHESEDLESLAPFDGDL
ncbi:hypothetical protein F5Y06DRAFT_299681 [Hypoxylon sp. FL0890]|nr:hypothetical protein F5Y06DRAFT_299681 [Hypoxylon sp. FL0890]